MAAGDLFLLWKESGKGDRAWTIDTGTLFESKEEAFSYRDYHRDVLDDVDFEIVEVIDG